MFKKNKFLHFPAINHLRASVNDHKLMESCRSDGLAHYVTVGVAANLGGGFLEELLYLRIGGGGLAVFKFHNVRVGHALVDVAEGQEEDVVVAAVVVQF